MKKQPITYNIWLDGSYPCKEIISTPYLICVGVVADTFQEACFKWFQSYVKTNELTQYQLLFENGYVYFDGRRLDERGHDFVEYYKVTFPESYINNKGCLDSMLLCDHIYDNNEVEAEL